MYGDLTKGEFPDCNFNSSAEIIYKIIKNFQKHFSNQIFKNVIEFVSKVRYPWKKFKESGYFSNGPRTCRLDLG